MALFKIDPARAAYPQCMLLHGSFVVPASVVYNQQIIPTALALTNAGTSGAQVSNTVNPTGLKVNIFAAPLQGVAIPATNTARLPQGQQPSGGVSPVGSEYLLDLTAFPADIVSCELDICRQARNSVTNDVQASFIDTVNKLIYVQVVAFTTGASSAPAAGNVISFQVAFKDSIGV